MIPELRKFSKDVKNKYDNFRFSKYFDDRRSMFAGEKAFTQHLAMTSLDEDDDMVTFHYDICIFVLSSVEVLFQLPAIPYAAILVLRGGSEKRKRHLENEHLTKSLRRMSVIDSNETVIDEDDLLYKRR